MSIIRGMLAERLAVVAEHDEERLALETAAAQAIDQGTERRVTLVNGVQIAVEVGVAGKRPRAVRKVGMVGGDRHVGDEERR